VSNSPYNPPAAFSNTPDRKIRSESVDCSLRTLALYADPMDRETGKSPGRKLAPTHRIVGVYDHKQHVQQMTAIYAEQAQVRWANAKLLVNAKPGDTVRITTRQGYTTQVRAEEQEIKAAHYLFSRYLSLDKFIANEVKDARRGSGYVDGKQYVLKEVRGERSIANAIANYQSRGFRYVRAVPIDEEPVMGNR
jgi:hypothetical protein